MLQYESLNEPPPSFAGEPVATLADVDKLLILADQTPYQGRRSAVVVASALARILRQGPYVGLAYLEARYRALGSATFLLGAPKRLAPPKAEPRSLRRHRKKAFFLWVCVNGEQEAAQMMERFDITDAQDNLKRLKETGILVAKR